MPVMIIMGKWQLTPYNFAATKYKAVETLNNAYIQLILDKPRNSTGLTNAQDCAGSFKKEIKYNSMGIK